MIVSMQSRSHQVMTGVCLALSHQSLCLCDCVSTDVWFGEVPESELQAYLDTDEPYDKAGAYGIQGWAGRHITRISGDYNNVVGLPVERVLQMLEEISGLLLRQARMQ